MKHASWFARLDEEEVQAHYNADIEFQKDVKQSIAIGIHSKASKLDANPTGISTWIQRFVGGFDYLRDQDKVNRADADLWRDGCIIEFIDEPTGTVYAPEEL